MSASKRPANILLTHAQAIQHLLATRYFRFSKQSAVNLTGDFRVARAARAPSAPEHQSCRRLIDQYHAKDCHAESHQETRAGLDRLVRLNSGIDASFDHM
jgi:hypothetical protein